MAEFAEWDYSEAVYEDESMYVPLSEGVHTLYVENASYNPDTREYNILLSSLDKPGERSRLRYYLRSKDGSDNNRAIGTLITMKGAITGIRKGILTPAEIMHAVLCAEVKPGKPKEYNGEIRTYPQIYEYFGVAADTLSRVSEVVPVNPIQIPMEG